MAEKIKSSSHERMVKGYLKPKAFNKFDTFVKTSGAGKSEALNEMIEYFFAHNVPEKPRSKHSY